MSEVETSRYKIAFAVAGLPRSPNELLGAHWTIRAGHAKKWLKLVERALMLNGRLPAEPLPFAHVHCVRLSSGVMDDDNLRSSFKSVVVEEMPKPVKGEL